LIELMLVHRKSRPIIQMQKPIGNYSAERNRVTLGKTAYHSFSTSQKRQILREKPEGTMTPAQKTPKKPALSHIGGEREKSSAYQNVEILEFVEEKPNSSKS
jgi:hypothetical protein